MRNPFVCGVGGVLSADIAVPEHEQELRFYSLILTTGRSPLWRADLTNNRGTPVIGLGARSSEYESLPMQWMPHIQVADVGASAGRAVELGGSEIMHGKNENDESQWAVLVDPAGAAFGVIPAVGADQGLEVQSEAIGCISWLTLVVSDVVSECEFYEQVIGWSTVSTNMAERVEMCRPGGESVAEIRRAGEDTARIPPVWILSLRVGDFEKSIRLVGECGGEVLSGAAGAGYAVIRDPVGVCIALQASS